VVCADAHVTFFVPSEDAAAATRTRCTWALKVELAGGGVGAEL
jgi:hypothetical protein